jgi:hypothetical protein
MLGEIELLVGVRGQRESDKAVQACNDYLRAGPGRSLAKLCERYQSVSRAYPEQPPTRRITTLKEWSVAYNWQARTTAFDAAADARKTVEQEVRRREVIDSGLALDYERIESLKGLAAFLGNQIREETLGATGHARYPNVWLRDVKNVSGLIADAGEDGIVWKVEEVYRFNASLIDQYRSTLDDIAKEVGGRKQKLAHEHTGKDGGPIEHEDVGLSDEQRVSRIASLFERARERAAASPAGE